MKSICKKISLQKKDKRLISEIEKRIGEFNEFSHKGNKEWFSELCYCLLTANSSAALCIKVQREADKENAFLKFDMKKLKKLLRNGGYRFYNKRAEYIINARRFSDIKNIIKNKNDKEAREWLVKNIKGLGWKEASHFLRNTGRKDVAIIDRHILRCLGENVKSLNEKNYLRIERRLENIAAEVKLNLAELDLYLWSSQTGAVLK